ncbi:MAG: hypothetical protein ACR2IF_08715 [Terriglobales bacterium]
MFALFLGIAPALINAQTARVAVPAGPPANVQSIWVLGHDGKMSRYDTAQYKMWMGGMPLPAEAGKHPEAVSVSRAGEVLYAYASDGRSSLRRWWRSVPTHSELIGGAWDKRPARGGGYSVLEATPAVYFSSDGQGLFWFEHRSQRLNRGGPDFSREARFLAWATDINGENPAPVAEFAFPSCKCETGVCSESCPEALAWAPDRGVDDFFFLTRWVPGQIQSDFQETSLYQRSGGAWVARKLPHPLERILDAADHGNVYVETLPDAGCCGWANDSNDVTSVVRGETATVIFDERRRFQNNNYDVSFFTVNALLSPDLAQVAYTIDSTQQGEEEIRLSSDGKPNPEELKRLHNDLAALPRVEVVNLATPDKIITGIAQAELVGWLDPGRILIVKGGEVQTVDVISGKVMSTAIKAEGSKFVFLR